jgi:hypothetical protein
VHDLAQSLLVWLRRKAGSDGKKLRAGRLVESAATGLRVDAVDLRAAFRELRADELIAYAPDTLGLPFTGFVTVVPKLEVEPESSKTWRAALEASGMGPELIQALVPSHAHFTDLDAEDLLLAAKGLLTVQSEPRAANEFGFSLSARHILGSSKVFERLTPQARRLLGVDSIPSTPRYVVVAGLETACTRAVLLIENSTTYEMAVATGLDREATLIAAYGYGLNMMSDSIAGWALVESINSGHCQILGRTGSNHDLEQLLRHERVLFWGDLDREGLRIALALRRHVPQLQLSALYAPMCDLVLRRETSHPYSVLTGKAQQNPWTPCDDALIDSLAVKCATRAVDQEAVNIDVHRQLAAEPLWGALQEADRG